MTHATQQFIETMGRQFEEEGAPRIAGRIFGALMLCEGAASLDDLAEQLQVSKGSVSTNARMLDGWGLVTRVTRPGDRRDYYQVTADVPARMLERHLGSLRRVLGTLQDSRATVPCTQEVACERLDHLVAAHARAVDVLAAALAELRAPGRPAPSVATVGAPAA
jgi:DNA-binding MarR family transcriptional regulator